MAQKENKKSKKNKNIGFAWALWILIAILILLVFLVKKDTIVSNLKTTGFFDRVFGSTPQFVEKHEVVENESKVSKKKGNKNQDEDVVVLDVTSDKPTMDSLKKDSASDIIVLKESQTAVSVQNEPADKEEDKIQSQPEEKKVSEPVKVEKKEDSKVELPKPVEQKKTDLTLCFLLFDSDGGVSRKIVKRSVVKNDSPLTDAINLLLKGPVLSNSAEKDCISLIPEGTRLLSAKVQDGVAYLNFSEEFEFNSYAAEGYRHQLEQIVFTATSFSTVKSVQFLIEGVQEQYLGSEGVWIGSPLARSSF